MRIERTSLGYRSFYKGKQITSAVQTPLKCLIQSILVVSSLCKKH